MDRSLLRDFWNCGDDQIIEFALMRAHLNKPEREAVTLMLDECMTQEQAAEHLDISTRRLQDHWYSASGKLLRIPWVMAYAKEIRKEKEG